MDLKPDNLMLASSDFASAESSIVEIIDFGLCRRYQTDDGKHSSPGQEEFFIGNLIYSSPD